MHIMSMERERRPGRQQSQSRIKVISSEGKLAWYAFDQAIWYVESCGLTSSSRSICRHRSLGPPPNVFSNAQM